MENEAAHLYFQHWMWRRQLGYLLNPAIPMNDDCVVADVASGTSIWLLDLARDHPKATLEGFDISSAQYPHPRLLPDNVHLNILDILRPIPADLRGKFDIVHVGLVVLVVENGNPSALLENLLTMLKPNGFLQWDEADFGGLSVESPSDCVPHVGLSELRDKVLKLMFELKGSDFG
ncbi:MAG: hypothetical protein OHK93_001656 [Ramalina farinacea]|uniref:Methyltransferase domain-containing protein n=1 Tax=Ramalina farinacea TaxID=258253 RepID=A0AA43QPX6_9LECA|nr:hypothetical protein [Ramalina farinacea]